MSPTPGYLIWRLSTRWRVAVDRALAPLGLTHAQYVVLGSLSAILSTGHQPTQRELAGHTGLEPLYVSKLARTLDAAGIVARAGDPADSRAVRLSLTPRGRAVVDEAVAVVAGLLDRQLAPLGGLDSDRTRAFARDLHLLLDAPLEDTP